jgi:hypothetical protein
VSLAEFLLARIAEDYRFVPKYHEPMCEWMMRHDRDEEAECDCGLESRQAFVLAECDAKRRIVERCQQAHVDQGIYGEDSQDELAGHILRLLALPYADHPEYQPEWRV